MFHSHSNDNNGVLKYYFFTSFTHCDVRSFFTVFTYCDVRFPQQRQQRCAEGLRQQKPPQPGNAQAGLQTHGLRPGGRAPRVLLQVVIVTIFITKDMTIPNKPQPAGILL